MFAFVLWLSTTDLQYVNLLPLLAGAIHACTLVLRRSNEGKPVFRNEHGAVMSLTPDVRQKAPPILWVALCIVVSAFVAGIMIAASRVDWSARMIQTQTR